MLDAVQIPAGDLRGVIHCHGTLAGYREAVSGTHFSIIHACVLRLVERPRIRDIHIETAGCLVERAYQQEPLWVKCGVTCMNLW